MALALLPAQPNVGSEEVPREQAVGSPATETA
jgi:hypothetical protein